MAETASAMGVFQPCDEFRLSDGSFAMTLPHRYLSIDVYKGNYANKFYKTVSPGWHKFDKPLSC
jgi:hypothetical protein